MAQKQFTNYFASEKQLAFTKQDASLLKPTLRISHARWFIYLISILVHDYHIF